MKNQKSFELVMFIALMFACLQTAATGQMVSQESREIRVANVTGAGSSVRWDVVASNSGGSLTIAAPDGRVFHKEFRAGASPEFTLTDTQAERLPDGTYTYELRLAPAFSPGIKEALKAARGSDDDPGQHANAQRCQLSSSPEASQF